MNDPRDTPAQRASEELNIAGILRESGWHYDVNIRSWVSPDGRRLEDIALLELNTVIDDFFDGVKHVPAVSWWGD